LGERAVKGVCRTGRGLYVDRESTGGGRGKLPTKSNTEAATDVERNGGGLSNKLTGGGGGVWGGWKGLTKKRRQIDKDRKPGKRSPYGQRWKIIGVERGRKAVKFYLVKIKETRKM